MDSTPSPAPRRALVVMMAAAAAVLAMVPSPVRPDGIDSIVMPTGMSVEARVDPADRLVIAITPTSELRLNGHLGVGFAAGAGRAAWTADLPILLTVDQDYFDGPVVRELGFDPARLDAPAVLDITFGTCLQDPDVCILEEASAMLERGTNGAVELTLAAVGP